MAMFRDIKKDDRRSSHLPGGAFSPRSSEPAHSLFESNCFYNIGRCLQEQVGTPRREGRGKGLRVVRTAASLTSEPHAHTSGGLCPCPEGPVGAASCGGIICPHGKGERPREARTSFLWWTMGGSPATQWKNLLPLAPSLTRCRHAPPRAGHVQRAPLPAATVQLGASAGPAGHVGQLRLGLPHVHDHPRAGPGRHHGRELRQARALPTRRRGAAGAWRKTDMAVSRLASGLMGSVVGARAGGESEHVLAVVPLPRVRSAVPQAGVPDRGVHQPQRRPRQRPRCAQGGGRRHEG
jgi:hypothetical protein